MNKVSLVSCYDCPSWWRWYDDNEPEKGGWCVYDNNRINCCWSEDEIEREEG